MRGSRALPLAPSRPLLRPRLRAALVAYLFLAPALVLLSAFTFAPLAFGTLLAFADYNVLRPPRWVGLENFRFLVEDPAFGVALRNSLRYLLVVPAIQLAALLLALLVNRRLVGILLFRAAYYVPVITSFAVAGLMWNWMYAQHGVVNWVGLRLGLLPRPFEWLNHPTLALYAVMLVTFWKGIGYYMVLYLAGLQAVPRELEEAARVDGAGRLQVFLFVTLPLLRPTLLLCTLLSTLAALKVFEEVYVMTGGGPFGQTATALLYVYQKAFQEFRWGLAAAAGLLVAVIGLLFSALHVWVFREGGLRPW
ncbi:MAG: sugar ABC transporter permease [Armatimonadetes bacterium]|nr:sugar ABC transporter permease [Armatimonadota bacterium]MDW8153559.1 sugar ABC transporter permease [Armatimonadota bacterium]